MAGVSRMVSASAETAIESISSAFRCPSGWSGVAGLKHAVRPGLPACGSAGPPGAEQQRGRGTNFRTEAFTLTRRSASVVRRPRRLLRPLDERALLEPIGAAHDASSRPDALGPARPPSAPSSPPRSAPSAASPPFFRRRRRRRLLGAGGVEARLGVRGLQPGGEEHQILVEVVRLQRLADEGIGRSISSSPPSFSKSGISSATIPASASASARRSEAVAHLRRLLRLGRRRRLHRRRRQLRLLPPRRVVVGGGAAAGAAAKSPPAMKSASCCARPASAASSSAAAPLGADCSVPRARSRVACSEESGPSATRVSRRPTRRATRRPPPARAARRRPTAAPPPRARRRRQHDARAARAPRQEVGGALLLAAARRRAPRRADGTFGRRGDEAC